MIKITITGNPFTLNQQYVQRKGRGRRCLTSEARAYGYSVGWQAKAQHRGKPLTGDLEVIYHYYFYNNIKRDHLNFNKILNDRFNQIVWKDDSQIKISHHYTHYDKENPRVELIITKI